MDDSYWAKEAGRVSADNAILNLRINKLEAQLAKVRGLQRHQVVHEMNALFEDPKPVWVAVRADELDEAAK